MATNCHAINGQSNIIESHSLQKKMSSYIHQDTCYVKSVLYPPQSLKSAVVFSHPAEDSGIAATRSTSFVLRFRLRSVQSSYIVERLKSSVCDEWPDSTRCSRIWRPLQSFSYCLY